MHARRVPVDRGAPGREPLGCRVPAATADIHVPWLEVEVAACVGVARSGVRERRGNIRFVRRLVLREPNVAVDPEWRGRSVGPQRDSGRREALVYDDAELLERLLQEPFVV